MNVRAETPAGADAPAAGAGGLSEVVRYFLRLGVIAFGGPAAHIALMRRDLVQRRKWVTDEEFVDMLGVTNLIPGPNSTELAMHMGSARAGWRGLWLGGLCFIGPAVLIVLALAWAYVRYGDTPTGTALIYGIQPFILAVIVQAIWGLRRAVLKSPATVVAGVIALALAVLGVNEIVVLLGTGAGMLVYRKVLPLVLRGGRSAMQAMAPVVLVTSPPGYSHLEMFLVFLKIGSVLYGSGYVLLAFMQGDLVNARGWLTEAQLVDAIAVGQFTPGPVFSSATFAGYVVGGVPGSMAATAGIFLPSFVFVTLTHPLIPRLRQSPWASPFLDGVNVAAFVLMGVVTVVLAREALDDVYTAVLFAVAAVVLVRFSPNSAWLVVAGAAAGIAHQVVTSSW